MTDYLLLKTVHLIAATLVVGHLTTSIIWKTCAVRSRDRQLILFAIRQTKRLGLWLTAPSILVVMVTGIVNVMTNMYAAHHAAWVLWGFSLASLSLLAWFLGLRPLESKQLAWLANNGLEGKPSTTWRALERRWLIWAVIAAVPPYLAIIVMVYKWS